MSSVWHYVPHAELPLDISSRAGINRPKVRARIAAACGEIPFYWDEHTPNRLKPAVAFLPINLTDVRGVLAALGLKGGRWMTEGVARILVKATPTTPAPPVAQSREELVRTYSEARSQARRAKLAQAQQALRRHQQEATRLMESLTEAYRDIEETAAQVNLWEQQLAGLDFSAELETLSKIAQVDKLEMTEDAVLTVRTKPLSAQGVTFGRFRIRLPLTAGVGLKIINETPLEADGYSHHHPHVSSITTCWGNLGPTIAQLTATGDIPTLVVTIIQFLESFRTDINGGAGGHAEHDRVFHLFKDRQEQVSVGKEPS